MRLRRNIDMTNGPLLGKMIAYTIPIILSGCLQLLYNAADLIVIGQFAGSDAFAAVGSTGSLNNLFITIFVALSGGGCICVAQYYGAKDGKNVSETVHTCILISIIGGVAVAVLSLFFVDDALKIMGTHEDIIDMATLYLRIILAVAPCTLFYNFAAGILRATGDTQRPFFILIFTGLVNVVLNLILVIIFRMDVAGVAIATAVGSILNALIGGYLLVKSGDSIRLNFKDLKIHKDKLIKVLNYGIPSAMHSLLFSVSNVLIQSAVNSFDSVAVIAGNAAASNIEGFIYTSMNSVAQTALNFSGQNFGARKYKRITRVLLNGCIMVFVVGGGMGLLANIFAQPLLSIYEPADALAREKGMIRLSIIATLYFMCGMYEVILNTLRGLGSSWAPTVTTFIAVGGVRIMWVLFVFPQFHTLQMLYVAWPLTWVTSIILLGTIFLTTRKRHFARNEAQHEQQVQNESA